MNEDIDIDKFIDDMKQNLVYYLDHNVYLPVKEELVGIEHSLGIRKDLFKEYLESELERLKVAIKADVTDKEDIKLLKEGIKDSDKKK